MGMLKNLVRQRHFPKGSMAEGYLHYESIFYFSHILVALDVDCSSRWVEDDTVDVHEVEDVMIGAERIGKMKNMEYAQVHTFCLHNSEPMQEWLQHYEQEKDNLGGTGFQRFPKFPKYMTMKMAELHTIKEHGGDISGFPSIEGDVHLLV